MTFDVLIAGGGLAAQRCIETLRARGFDGRIRVLCAEPHPPYDRPPLSKEVLAGTAEDLSFRPAAWYAERDVELLLGHRAVALDAGARHVEVAGAGRIGYDRLLIATGSRPRTLPLDGALTLRDRSDAQALSERLRPGARLAIVGAGFIGQEVAASARRLGLEVTLIEALDAPLARVLPPSLGRWFARLHREEGVRVEVGAGVGGARPGGLLLTDGRTVAADTVLAAVGTQPDTAWLGLGGAPVPVDAEGRTGWTAVWAAGDVAGCDHWEPAARQGAAVARSMLGLPAAPAVPTSFWTDQYGLRIQLVGDPRGADRVVVEDGAPEARDFTAVLQRRGSPVAALLVNRPHELPTWRRRLAAPQTEERIAA